MPIIAIDVPNADLTLTNLDTNADGHAGFTFPDTPPVLPDGVEGVVPTAKQYAASCEREAKLLVEAAIGQGENQPAPSPEKKVTLDVADVPAAFAIEQPAE